MKTVLALIAFVVAEIVFGQTASAGTPERHLEACLKKADDLPDIAFAEAGAWLKAGGGGGARLCRATAQFHRGEFLDAAREFAALAAASDVKDRKHAASLHEEAGLSFMRGNDFKNSEQQYAAAIALEPDEPEVWVDRATERASDEKYWDAIDDLNRALKIMPDNALALRLRGQAWMKLDQETNAVADFAHAQEVEAQDRALSAKSSPQSKQ